MFCEKCGKQFENGEKFCTNCGNPAPTDLSSEENTITPESATENTVETQITADAEFVPSNPDIALFQKKRGFIKKIAIIAVFVIVCFGIVSRAAPYISNTASKLIMSPSKYFRYIAKKNGKDISKTASAVITNIKDVTPSGNSVTGKLSIETGEALEDIIYAFGGSDANEYYDFIDWLKSANLEYNVSFVDKKLASNIKIGLNGKNIASLNTVADTNDESVYMGIPEYNSEYIAVPIENNDDFTEEITSAINGISDIIPSQSKTEAILYRYLTCAVGQINNVTESKTTLEANGISQKCTKLTVTIDGKTCSDITKAVLNELKSDKDIKKLVSDLASTSDEFTEIEDAYEDAMGNIDEIIEEAEYLEDMDELLSIEIWVDGKGDIIGASTEIDGVEIYTKQVKKGSKFGSEFGIKEPSSNVKISGGGKISGSNRSGDFILKVMGMEIAEFSVKNLDTDKLENGIFKGALSIKASDNLPLSMLGDDAEILSDFELKLKSASDSVKKTDLALELYYKGNLCAKTNMSSAIKEAAKIKTPAKYIETDDEYAIREWIDNTDFDKLIDKLQSANLPNELTEYLEDALEQIR